MGLKRCKNFNWRRKDLDFRKQLSSLRLLIALTLFIITTISIITKTHYRPFYLLLGAVLIILFGWDNIKYEDGQIKQLGYVFFSAGILMLLFSIIICFWKGF
jgi:uncharacterized membrane protein